MRARAAGAIGLPAERTGPGADPAWRAGRTRSSPSAAWLASPIPESPIPESPTEAMVISGPMPANPLARSLPTRSPMLARANPMRANVEMARPRGLASIAMIVLRAAGIGRIGGATGKEEVRARIFPRARGMARSAVLRRAAAFARIANGPLAPLAVIAAGAYHARSSATARGVTGAMKSPGKSASVWNFAARRGRRVTKCVAKQRAFRARVKIARTVQNSIGRAANVTRGRSVRAGMIARIAMTVPVAMIGTIARVVTMRMTAGFS